MRDMISGKEWTPFVNNAKESASLEVLKAWVGKQNNTTMLIDLPWSMGLYFDQYGRLCPSHFVGITALEQITLVIQPRFPDVDVGTMFIEAAASGFLDLEKSFACRPEENLDVPNDDFSKDLTLIQVLAYLATLSRFLERHLRKDFVKVRENLSGRIRGRILIANQLRHNASRGLEHRMMCDYSVMSCDTLENRILKAALETASRWLDSVPGLTPGKERTWVNCARAALAEVPNYAPQARDWQRVRKHGLMHAYARPLALARMILSRLRVNHDGSVINTGKATPFYLDMNQLFEAWTGVWLVKAGLIPQSQTERTLEKIAHQSITFRPDYILTNRDNDEGIVLDAKYKPVFTEDTGKKHEIINTDVYQVLAYSHLLNLTSAGTNLPPIVEAWLIFPDKSSAKPFDNAKNSWQNRSKLTSPSISFGILGIPMPGNKQP